MGNEVSLITGVSVYITTLIICASLTVMLFNNFYRTDKGHKLHQTMRRTALLFALSCCLRVMLLMVHYVGLAVDDLTNAPLTRGETRSNRIADWCQIGMFCVSIFPVILCLFESICSFFRSKSVITAVQSGSILASSASTAVNVSRNCLLSKSNHSDDTEVLPLSDIGGDIHSDLFCISIFTPPICPHQVA